MRSYLRYWCEAFRLPELEPRAHRRRRSASSTTTSSPTPSPTGAASSIALPHMGNWDHAGAWATLAHRTVVTVAERLKPEELYEKFLAYRARSRAWTSSRSPAATRCSRTSPSGCARATLVALLGDRDLSQLRRARAVLRREGQDARGSGGPGRRHRGRADHGVALLRGRPQPACASTRAIEVPPRASARDGSSARRSSSRTRFEDGIRRAPGRLAHAAAALGRGPRPVEGAARTRDGVGRTSREGRHRLPLRLVVARRRPGARPRPRRGAAAARARGQRAGPGEDDDRPAAVRRVHGRRGVRGLQRVAGAGGVRPGLDAPGAPLDARGRASTCCTCTSRPRPSLSILSCWAARGPIVATWHSSMARSRILAAGVLASVQTALEKISARIAVSEAARQTLVEHIGGDAVLIPNGVDCSAFGDARAARRAGPARAASLFFIGRIDEPRKGLQVLLEALPDIIAEQHPGVRLLVAGPGDVEEIQSDLPPEIARAGHLPRPGVGGGQGARVPVRRHLRRAEHRRRELRHRAARGDGQRHPGAGQRPRGVPAGLRRGTGRGVVRQRGPRRPRPRGDRAARRRRRARAPAARGLPARAEFDWETVAQPRASRSTSPSP